MLRNCGVLCLSRGLPKPLVYHVPHASHAAVSHGACHQACHFLYFIYSNIADHDKSNCLANSFQVCFHSPSALPVSDHGTRHHMRVPHCATKLVIEGRQCWISEICTWFAFQLKGLSALGDSLPGGPVQTARSGEAQVDFQKKITGIPSW